MTQDIYFLGFIPPPRGGGDWLSFYPCPFSTRAGIDPWFRQFANAGAASVRDSLRREWQEISDPMLKAFSQALLEYHPIGLLHSLHLDGGDDNAWLVLSQFAPSDDLVRAVTNRIDYPGLIYLAAVREESGERTIGAASLVRDFFRAFGGLRIGPPFMAQAVYRAPEPPVDRLLPEPIPFEPEWAGALAFFQNDVGDELLLNSAMRCGWLDFHTRQINFVATFEQFLKDLANARVPFQPR